MLSPLAEKTINEYFNLPFPGLSGIRCPYFNNSKLKQRGQLRVLIGKGSPKEILEESKIISIQYQAGVFERGGKINPTLTSENIRKFLIDHGLGIECSGFVTQILREHYLETKKIDFTKKVFIYEKSNIFRHLISRLRPVENIDVRVYADPQNTEIIKLSDVKAGDVITMIETGINQKRNHILLIHNVNGNTIEYVHARAWSSEGQYGHGVSRGTITITNPNGSLLAQKWVEKNLENDQNETYIEAKQAKNLELRRLKI